MASTVLEQRITNLQRMDEIIAGPHSVEIDKVAFFMPNSALDALKALDQRFGVPTVERKTHEREFSVWRNLKVYGMELRIEFYTAALDLEWNYVFVFGLKKKDDLRENYFDGREVYDCYLRFLDGFAFSQDHANAVAMGQHAKLGSESLLGILPEALFRNLLQPQLPELEHWDCDKEDAFKETIKQQEFEVAKGLLDELVATDSIDMSGELLFEAKLIKAACIGLDQRFDELTPEEERNHYFYARRRLHINGRIILFKFRYDRYGGRVYIRVRGLGQVTAQLSSMELDDGGFVYFLDTLLRHGTNPRYEITTGERYHA